jgi:hypothetical protein
MGLVCTEPSLEGRLKTCSSVAKVPSQFGVHRTVYEERVDFGHLFRRGPDQSMCNG